MILKDLEAVKTAYSSIVGQSVTLREPSGRVYAQLSIRPMGYSINKDDVSAIADRFVELWNGHKGVA